MDEPELDEMARRIAARVEFEDVGERRVEWRVTRRWPFGLLPGRLGSVPIARRVRRHRRRLSRAERERWDDRLAGLRRALGRAAES